VLFSRRGNKQQQQWLAHMAEPAPAAGVAVAHLQHQHQGLRVSLFRMRSNGFSSSLGFWLT